MWSSDFKNGSGAIGTVTLAPAPAHRMWQRWIRGDWAQEGHSFRDTDVRVVGSLLVHT